MKTTKEQIASLENYLTLLNQIISNDPLFSIHWNLPETQKRFEEYSKETMKEVQKRNPNIFEELKSLEWFESYLTGIKTVGNINGMAFDLTSIPKIFVYNIAQFNHETDEYNGNLALKGSEIWLESDEKYLKLFKENIKTQENLIFGRMFQFQRMLDTLRKVENFY